MIDAVERYVDLKSAGADWKGRCPAPDHDDHTPSFFVFGDRFHCFGCGKGGDVIDFIKLISNVETREAVAILTGDHLPAARPEKTGSSKSPKQKNGEYAKALWKRSQHPGNSPVEAYLATRGITLPVPGSIHFANLHYPEERQFRPVMLAAITDPEDDVVAVQRTFLRHDGGGKADVPEPRLSLGSMLNGAIRLGWDNDEICICEGVETALSLEQLSGIPSWATGGVGRLHKVRFPSWVKKVVIGRDNDAVGETGAIKAAHVFAQLGIGVRIISPHPSFKDFNDELREASNGR